VDGVDQAIPDRRLGTVVAPADSARLAREILALAEDPQARADMGRRARAHIRDTFSVDAMVQGTAQVYRRVLHGPQSSDQRPSMATAGG
jgi:glycosyltransferase involved in cell wall biosynthesis